MTAKKGRARHKFDLFRELSFTTGKYPELEQYLQSVVGTSNDNVWASLFIDPQNAKVTHFNLMARKSAWVYFEDAALDIDQKMHELQSEEKRRKDGICEGTGTELPVKYMYHHFRHRPSPNEVYYEERLKSTAKLYHRLDFVPEGDFHKIENTLNQEIERVNQELKGLNPESPQQVAAVTLERDLRPVVDKKEYEIRFVALPPPQLRGQYRETDENLQPQLESLKKDPGRSSMELVFRDIKSTLAGLRNTRSAQGL